MSLTSQTSSTGFRDRFKRMSGNSWAVLIALFVYALLSTITLAAAGTVPHVRIDLSPLLRAGLTIQIHVISALMTLGIGIILMFAPKGFRIHRTLGWTWVLSMTVTAGSSFVITSIFENHYSPIHALSAWTMIGLPMGIAAIRRKDVRAHRKQMTGMFAGGMLVAGLFSFLPGRLMWSLFFSV